MNIKRTLGITTDSLLNSFFDLIPGKMDVFLASLDKKADDIYSIKKDYKILTTFKKPIVTYRSNFLKLLHELNFILRLPYFLTKYDRFIFYRPPHHSSIVYPIIRAFGKEVIIISVDAYEELIETKPMSPIFKCPIMFIARFQEFFSMKFANANFVVSKYLVDKYSRHSKNVFYIPNGADIETLQKIKTKSLKFPYIIYIGSILKWRGVDMLIQAFEKIQKDFPNLRLVIIGRGYEEDIASEWPEVDRAIRNNPKILKLGWMPHKDAIGYLKGARIAIIPNRDVRQSYTISSIKCFENIACGVPQIVTDSGEHAYWVRKLDVGLVVKSDIHSISEGILKILHDKKLYEKFKKKCAANKLQVDYKVTRAPLLHI